MAKKKFKINLKVAVDAPVTITFAVVSVVFFMIDSLILKGKLSQSILASPTSKNGDLPFAVSNAASYFRLILYAFGASGWSALLTNLLFVLLLGPAMEERYGSVIIGIMIAVSVLFAGVLNACFCPVSLRGCTPVVFMMIFLNSFMSFSKKKIPLSFILIFVIYIAREIMEKLSESVGAAASGGRAGQIAGIIICIAGGLCGSLFAFLTSPKARAEKKAQSKAAAEKSEKAEREAYLEELDSQSPRNKKSRRNDDDDETTVVGTLKF